MFNSLISKKEKVLDPSYKLRDEKPEIFITLFNIWTLLSLKRKNQLKLHAFIMILISIMISLSKICPNSS